MGEMAEDRVYDERRGETVAYLATGEGVAAVRVSSDRVGRFALAERCRARDVATVTDPTGDARVFAATDEGVLAGPDPFEPVGFGESVAVGTDAEGTPLAADSDGAVARYRDGEWTPLGTIKDVRAIEGAFVAAADGVFRVDGDDLAPVGLADVRDVTSAGAPLAATDDGLYRLGNGWLREREGRFTVVATAGGRTAATDDGASDGASGGGPAHAATADSLFAREAGGEWEPVALPTDEPVADVAYGECPYVVTERGTFLIDADPERTPDGAGGWRSRSLGLPNVAALAVA